MINGKQKKKEKIKSQTNKKDKKLFHKTYEILTKVQKKKIITNSNTKSNINSKLKKEVKISNIFDKKQQQNNSNKMLINRVNEEDKDLESLLSELKTTFQQKTSNANEEYIDKNKFYLESFKYNTNEYYNINNKEKENNNFDLIDLHFDLEDQGHEISQRVHTRSAKTHFNLISKKEKIIKNIINPKKIISLNLIKDIKNNLGKGRLPPVRNHSNAKKKIIKNNTSFNKNKKKNLIKNKTCNYNLNDIPIKDPGKIRNIIKFKKSPNKNNKINNFYKMYKNSIVNSIKVSNKTLINTPKDYKINKTINLENSNIDNIKKINCNNISNNHSKKIGELYIRHLNKKIKNDRSIINIKRNKTYFNPFDNSSFMSDKQVTNKNINYHYKSFVGQTKTKLKNSYDYKKARKVIINS